MSGTVGASPLVTRSEWQARAPRSTSANIKPLGNTSHYEGPAMGAYDHASCSAKVRGIQAYHMDHNGWADIAYSSITCRHGYVFEGRWLGRRTAANGTNQSNDQSYAHCVMMGDGDGLTDEAKRGLHDVTAHFEAHGSGTAKWGHRDWLATSCPGDPLYAFVKTGLAIAPSHPPAPPAPTHLLSTPAVGVMASAGGYAVVSADGGVFAFGDFPFKGSAAGIRLSQPIVGCASTPNGQGYWLVASDGGVFAFGDAEFFGSMGGKPLNKPIVGVGGSTAGYVLVGGDGGVFPFGIPFVGSPA